MRDCLSSCKVTAFYGNPRTPLVVRGKFGNFAVMKRSVDESASRLISDAKVVFLLGVVGIHANFTADYGYLCSPMGEEILAALIDYILKICVPGFFLISGFLFFRNGEFTWREYKGKMRSRVHTLLIPYLLWNLVGCLLTFLKVSPWLSRYFPQYEGWPDVPWDILTGFVDLTNGYPYDISLWFIRNLLIIICVAWVLKYALKWLKWGAPLLLLALTFIPELNFWKLAESFFYFGVGASIGYFSINFASCIHKVGPLSLLLWILLGTANFLCAEQEWSMYIEPLRNLSGVMGALWILLKISLYNLKGMTTLRGTAFFVYAFHILYCSLVWKGVFALIPPESTVLTLSDFMLIWGIMLGVALGTALIVRRLWPRLYSLLSGGRA